MAIENIAGGSSIEKTTEYSVEQDLNNLVPSGQVTIDKKTSVNIDQNVQVSGVPLFVRDKELSITRDRVTSRLGLAGQSERLLRKSVQQSIIYASLSQDEANDFEPASRAVIKIKIGDAFGRGAWTNLSVLRDIAQVAGFNIVVNVYEHWIKQFEFSDTTPIVDAVQQLVGIFKPRVIFKNNTLYILQARRAEPWQGMLILPAKIEEITQRESLLVIPRRLRLNGGLGPFDPTKYPGRMRLGSRSGVATVGRHRYAFHDFGSDTKLTETIEEKTARQESGLDAVRVTTSRVKTVIARTVALDAFENQNFVREEHIQKFSVDVEQNQLLVESEDQFNKYDYTHWRYTNPRMAFSAKALGRKTYQFEFTNSAGTPGKTTTKPVFGAGEQKRVFDKEAYFEETILTYKKVAGRLERKSTFRYADIVMLTTRPTKSGRRYQYFFPVPELDSSKVALTQDDYAKDSEGNTLDIEAYKAHPVYVQHISYKQLSKKIYSVTTVEYTHNQDIPNRLAYDIKITIAQVPSGDVPQNKIDYRKMNIWVEKELGGEGPVAEISDNNIIDWKQAQDILNEVSWQFISNKRATTLVIPGEIPLDVGMGISNTALRHKKSGISMDTVGQYAVLSNSSRQKSGSDGTVTTTLTVEGFV